MMELLVEEWCRIPPIEFQTLVEPFVEPLVEALKLFWWIWWLVANAQFKTLYVGVSFILAVTYTYEPTHCVYIPVIIF